MKIEKIKHEFYLEHIQKGNYNLLKTWIERFKELNDLDILNDKSN